MLTVETLAADLRASLPRPCFEESGYVDDMYPWRDLLWACGPQYTLRITIQLDAERKPYVRVCERGIAEHTMVREYRQANTMGSIVECYLHPLVTLVRGLQGAAPQRNRPLITHWLPDTFTWPQPSAEYSVWEPPSDLPPWGLFHDSIYTITGVY